MKLSTDSVHLIDKAVSLSMIAGIKKLIIEPGKIRGIDEKQTVALISTDNVPDLNGKQIGINRLEQLSARINLLKASGDMIIEATDSANGIDIALLELNVGKTKAQYRAASVEAMKGVPKNLSDPNSFDWEFKVESKILPILTQASSAMGSDTIVIASRDGQIVSFECVDGTKDVFTTDVEEAPRWIGKGNPSNSFCHKYTTKSLFPLLKEAAKTSDPVSIKLNDQGILSIIVGGFNFFVLSIN